MDVHTYAHALHTHTQTHKHSGELSAEDTWNYDLAEIQ